MLCNRTGYENGVDILQRKRRMKKKGSCKINGTCTAYITTKLMDEIIIVHYSSTHFGHQLDVGLLRLSKNDRNLIASKCKVHFLKKYSVPKTVVFSNKVIKNLRIACYLAWFKKMYLHIISIPVFLRVGIHEHCKSSPPLTVMVKIY